MWSHFLFAWKLRCSGLGFLKLGDGASTRWATVCWLSYHSSRRSGLLFPLASEQPCKEGSGKLVFGSRSPSPSRDLNLGLDSKFTTLVTVTHKIVTLLLPLSSEQPCKVGYTERLARSHTASLPSKQFELGSGLKVYHSGYYTALANYEILDLKC